MSRSLAILAAFLLSSVCFAQTATPYPQPGQTWQQPLGLVPNSSTAITIADSLLGQLHLANKTGSAVTVTLTDNSTNCGGSACQFWPVISIAANTVYENNFGGLLCTGGVIWSSNTANAVVGWVKGTYTLPLIVSAPQHHRSKLGGIVAGLHHHKPAPIPEKTEQIEAFGPQIITFP